MNITVPIQHIENEYIAAFFNSKFIGFECSHLHYHKELVEGDFWDIPGTLSHTYKQYEYICDNPECEVTIEVESIADGCLA